MHRSETRSRDDVPEGRSGRILLAEDDDALRELLSLSLRDRGHRVEECRNGMDVVRRIDDFITSHAPIDFDVVVSDVRMPGVTGLEALEGTRFLDGWPPTILITAFGDRTTHDEARRLGAAAMFDKPFDIDLLIAAIERILGEEGQ